MTKWINVNVDLPKNDEQVLVLIDGFFINSEDFLAHKRSLKIFQISFNRYKGWSMPYEDNNFLVKYWMPLPEMPNE